MKALSGTACKTLLEQPAYGAAFSAGPALITIIPAVIQSATSYKIDRNVFSKLRMIIVLSGIINLIMLFSEIFKELLGRAYKAIAHHLIIPMMRFSELAARTESIFLS